MEIETALSVLRGHDLLEMAEELEEISKICNCVACKEYRAGQPKAEGGLK